MLVSVAPGAAQRSDPDWLETMVGLARSPGTGLVGALIADDDEIIVHAGWDERTTVATGWKAFVAARAPETTC